MAVAADPLGVMVRLVRMAAGANLSLGHAPLMRQVTKSAVRRGVGEFEMKFRPTRMASDAGHERFYLLRLEVAARA